MKKLLYLISLIALAQISCCVFAAPQPLMLEENHNVQNNYVQPAMPPAKKVLRGGVRQVQELPQGMYGMWEVHGTLLDTNDYAKYTEYSSDIWILKKDGDFVTLINPESGASATITVTEVENNTATFIRKQKGYHSTESEQVTITLLGDKFTGTDLLVSQHDIGISTNARYRLQGTKISGQSLYNPLRQFDLQSRFSY